jgi:uncharacterized protein (UPF0332 family)
VTLDKNDKKNLSDIRMEKAENFLRDAEENLRNERAATAVNRSYYAALSASRSLLILEGVNPLSHEGVVTMLSLHFVKKNLLPANLIKTYKKLYSMRTDADYGDFDSTSVQDAQNAVDSAREILRVLDAVRAEFF